MVAKKAKINFEILPDKSPQFAILKLESEKKQSDVEGALQGAPSAFGTNVLLLGEII